MAEIPSLDSWREAFSLFERLVALDNATRERELRTLENTRPDLHTQVQNLLQAGPQTQAQALINAEAIGSAGIAGAQFGDWRLERQLGAGGMGEVWLASRADGLFKGQAAVKLLHPYLSSARVRGRFAREGQILGRLAHPHVARLLDAGIGPGGALYLVLEHIEGARLDVSCDARQLDLRSRLRLFLQVCEAVAYAHAHLIVHRDLKPSNILVTAEGEAKLLDFGIAKLLEQDDHDAELTRLGGLALTPEYASPEQLNGEPVSTAADVYALGLLLHVLLSGRHPFAEHLGQPVKLAQAVRETEPPPMSRSVREDAAAPRALRLPQLQRELRGDLDNIVAKALRRNAAERYISVLALADDLRRYLNHEAVLAQPESLAYRTRKFLRRHWAGAAAATAIVLSLVAGIVGTLWQAQRAQQEALRAEQHAAESEAQAARMKRIKDFFVSIFASADPAKRQDGSLLSLEEALTDALKRVDTELADDARLQADLLNDFGEIQGSRGQLAIAKTLFQRALPLHEKTLPPDSPVLANTLVNLGIIEDYLGQERIGLPYIERAVAILEKHAQTEGDALSNARTALVAIHLSANEFDKALPILQEVLAFYRQQPGEKERRLGIALANMGTLLLRMERHDDAKPYFEESIAVTERNSGKNSALLSDALRGLFSIARKRGDLATQSAMAERALAIARENFKSDHPWLARALAQQGEVLLAQQKHTEGENLLREALAMLDRIGTKQGHLFASLELVRSLTHTGQSAEALRYAAEGLARNCSADATAEDQLLCLELKTLHDAAAARKSG